jgi:hypothetical protein
VIVMLQWFHQQQVCTRLPTVSEPDISARYISAWTLDHWDILTSACFCPADVPAHGHFISMDVSTQEPNV